MIGLQQAAALLKTTKVYSGIRECDPHNLDVEPAIIQIASVNGSWPKAILAVNGLTQMANYGDHANFARCTMMPTQWDSSTSHKDPVIGWDSMAVMAALGGTATYQQAAHVASVVALANAMAATKDKHVCAMVLRP